MLFERENERAKTLGFIILHADQKKKNFILHQNLRVAF